MSTLPDDTASRPRRRGLSVRAKVLGSVLVMAATGMVTAQAASYAVQSARLDDRLDAALQQEISEFRALSEVGIDPATGEAVRDVEQLLQTALARNVADENETFLALVDGRPRFTPLGERPVALEREERLLEMVRALPRDAEVRLASVETSVGTVRYAAVQVVKTGSESVGTYVVAYASDRERSQLTESTRTYALVAVLALAVLAVVGSFVVNRLPRPLTLLTEAAQRTAGTDFGEPIPVRGTDEVSDLTDSVNAMLDRLCVTFEEQRTFIDDAGHELRTPVTIVRGHLELLDPSNEQDVVETRALLLDEVDRTSRLVEDLIVLAKARRPDFVQVAPVDVAQLWPRHPAVECRAASRGRGAGRPAPADPGAAAARRQRREVLPARQSHLVRLGGRRPRPPVGTRRGHRCRRRRQAAHLRAFRPGLERARQ